MEPLYNPSKLDELYDPSFTADISSKMQVPKRIRVAGDSEEVTSNGAFHHPRSVSNFHEYKYDMKVPDRILVVGQERHVGVKAPPHELVLENSILPMGNAPTFRAQTPPRTITVDALHGSGNEEESENEEVLEGDGTRLQLTKLKKSESQNSSLSMSDPPQLALTPSQLTEEVMVLRQQIGRLHRRMAGLEREQQQRQHRDALAISMGAVYLVWKVILWLTRSQ
nr:EOG090X08OG [Sida crystallina]